MNYSPRNLVVTASILGLALLGTVLAVPAHAQEKEEQEAPITKPQAKISPVQAMTTAQAKLGGKTAMATFQFEDGHWIYGVIVAKNHKLVEAEVDAVTGKIIDIEDVNPASEAKEYEHDLMKLAK